MELHYKLLGNYLVKTTPDEPVSLETPGAFQPPFQLEVRETIEDDFPVTGIELFQVPINGEITWSASPVYLFWSRDKIGPRLMNVVCEAVDDFNGGAVLDSSEVYLKVNDETIPIGREVVSIGTPSGDPVAIEIGCRGSSEAFGDTPWIMLRFRFYSLGPRDESIGVYRGLPAFFGGAALSDVSSLSAYEVGVFIIQE